MSSTSCPHGLPRSTCEICRVLEPTARPAARFSSSPARRISFPGGLATIAIVAVVAFVVVGWVSAAVWAVLRVLQLVVVAVVAGWVGWKLGVRHGKGRR